MSEHHLPECFWIDTPLKPKKVRGLCICERLRACEARVRLDEWGPLPADSVAEGVRLLQTIGLDITYTDEGLAVIARQMLRMGRADALAAALLQRDREDMEASEPAPPFPMGSKVRGRESGVAWGTVTGWDFYPVWGHWFVRVDTGTVDGEGEPHYSLHHPTELELAPDAAAHDDPCDCQDCRDAVEAQQELEFESLKAEGLA